MKRILIIGPGDVGKATLARILSGEIDWLTWELPEAFRQRWGHGERLPVIGEWPLLA